MIRPRRTLEHLSDTVIYEKRDSIAVVTLNRPERGNAISVEVHEALHLIWCDVP